MKVAVVQTEPLFGEVRTNVSRALALAESVTADLYVLPELFNSGYNFIDAHEVGQLAETSDGFTYRSIARFAATRSCFLVYGFAEKFSTLNYNSAALVGPEGSVGLYRKVHLYEREHLFFTPGDLGFPVFDLPIGRVGMMVCFDWIYPEAARTLAIVGAQLIAHPSNLVLPYCPDAMVTRCLENRVFAATANRVGRESRGAIDLSFIGTSEVVSPSGEILLRLDAAHAGIGVVEVDPGAADAKRINRFNDLIKGRRPEQYSVG